ncbi:hypothetical protein TRIUR3_21291 [Triticum urartu]|uniref:Uncharacterized protein n=1 Tax=Triticum urartu TaxID=4572 RepID=M7YS69_TRIUA|nr:hypothetical protein TRIUR3_21291 [Triticum urartu]
MKRSLEMVESSASAPFLPPPVLPDEFLPDLLVDLCHKSNEQRLRFFSPSLSKALKTVPLHAGKTGKSDSERSTTCGPCAFTVAEDPGCKNAKFLSAVNHYFHNAYYQVPFWITKFATIIVNRFRNVYHYAQVPLRPETTDL